MSYPENAAILKWLAQEIPEPVLEPELPIIDPHHHNWDLRQSGEQPHSAFEQKVYLCEDLARDISESGHNIQQTVFAQCGAMYRRSGPAQMAVVGETEFVHGIAAMSSSGLYGKAELCAGIFGTADCDLGKDVEPVLLAHMAASPNFRGIRAAFPADLNAQWQEGFAMLGKYDLAFDNYSPDYTRLPTLAKLAAAHPTITIIVNHLGGKIDPEMNAAEFEHWKECLGVVATCKNCILKCGGAQQRVGADWEPSFHMHRRAVPIGSAELTDTLFRFYSHAIEAFGAERCMFESNFPVDKECVSYRTLWNTFKRIAARMRLSKSEKSAIFAGTAARVYRLAPPLSTVSAAAASRL
eukprot:SAG11_NODE_1617_length_4575_cov_7.041332_4_plen_353_part_00